MVFGLGIILLLYQHPFLCPDKTPGKKRRDKRKPKASFLTRYIVAVSLRDCTFMNAIWIRPLYNINYILHACWWPFKIPYDDTGVASLGLCKSPTYMTSLRGDCHVKFSAGLDSP